MSIRAKRAFFIFFCLIGAFSALIWQRDQQARREYEKRFVNAVDENSPMELKNQVLLFYQDEIELDFPDSTELLYANDDKGELLKTTTALSMKLKISSDDREAFEKQIQQSNHFIAQDDTGGGGFDHRGPKAIWNPKSLKGVNKYTCGYASTYGGILWIGQEDGRTVIYLIYGV